MKRRVLSSVLSLALCLNLCPVWVLAAGETDGGMCPHHPAHTDDCGYAAPVLEQECTHDHDDSCYTAETACIHEHTAECYPDLADASEAAEPDLCAHVCTEDDGCVTQTLSCLHEHDEICGYVPGNPGEPCGFVCQICPIEALIDKLPHSVSEYNSEQVQAQISEIFDLYDELTEEEQQQVDLSPCVSLLDQIDELDAAVQSDDSDVEDILDADKNLDSVYVVSRAFLIDTNSHTLTALNSNAIQVTASGVLDLRGVVVSKTDVGVEVLSGGSLRITESSTNIKGETYALDIASGAKIHLSTGRYVGKSAAIRVADGDFAALLAPGCAYFDESGNPIRPEDMAKVKIVTVNKCTDHAGKSYKHTPGTTEHTWTCPLCGTEETEPCTYTFAQDGTGICDFCQNEVTIVVDRDSLKVLAYDETVQPENGTVTVTAKGAAKPLTLGTDYTVKYKTQAAAGDTGFTVTVTVEGITYNGTFTENYEFTKDELEKPVLEWDITSNPVPVELDYNGSPVEKDDLPPVIINIQTSAGVDLHDQLRYFHRAQGSGDAYTDGLPTNAGTYDVVVTLPEGVDYQAASSEPITLIINKISPIDTPPAAARPVYNGTKQELVTAGTLDPVAKRDGLEIKFATEENGTYSTAIPTGTNAGAYQVWYTVEVPAAVVGNYNAITPTEIVGVEIQRKSITPRVELSQTKYQYDGDWKEPAVTVKDGDTVLPTSEYSVTYENNQNVSTPDKPAKVIVTDKAGGNYDIKRVEVPFEITLREQAALSITKKPDTFIYGDKFTLGASGGSGNGLVTWEITDGNAVAEVDSKSGQVRIIGHGEATVQATKSGTDPGTGLTNYQDAVASLTFTAEKKSVTATVTAEDKDYDGNNVAIIHAVVEQGVLPGDVIDIQGLTGTFIDENAGVDKTVTVDTTGATITGKNSEHYDVSYSSTTVKATIRKAIAEITTAPVPAALTYDGTERDLIATAAVVDPAGVPVEYALSEDGSYSTDFPKGTNAGTYTVWYRIQETANYTGEAPHSVTVTIAKKPVNPTIELSGDGLTVETDGTYSYVYDGTAKEPVVTLKEADGTLIPAGEYTVEYSGNVNVGTATVTVTAKPDGNYSFTDVTKDFTIEKEKAKVTTAPEAAGEPLVFTTRAQKLVTPGAGTGGTMVYSLTKDDPDTYSETIPTQTNAGDYTVYYKVKGDANHSDSDVGQVEVTIAPKTVKDPTITLFDEKGDPLVSYTYDGSAKEPQATVVDGSTTIDAGEYEIRYENNTDAGNTATVNIIDKPGGNYTVSGSKTFVIQKANIVFAPAPTAADITYDGKAHELLRPGTASGGTVQYALNSATATYRDAIPTGTEAGDYTVYYKVVGDKNHNDLNDLVNQKVEVTIKRKPLTDITIELTPDSFEYDSKVKMPTVTVKFTEGKIETVVPITEYDWTCDNAAPTDQGTYTITITDVSGGNYDLTKVTANTATFTIGKTAQAELVIEDKPDSTIYGGTFTLTTSGGSSSSAVTWEATGPAIVDENTGAVEITGVGEVTITATNPGDTNYLPVSDQWTFTAAPKPVTASIVVGNRDYDGTTNATVTSASITTINGDTVTIDPASITAAFDTPGVGTGKTVTLDTSKVKVTGDTAKYAISYPDTVTADITQATTTITTAPAKIDPLTYDGQPQALVTVGKTNVGFLVYSLDGTNFSPDIPTGTDADTYTVYYKVDGTTDYTGVAVNTTPVSVTIAPKAITAKIEPSEFSFLYDGTKKEPELTVLDGKTVIDTDQYTVTWKNNNPMVTDGLLTIAGSYTATIENVPNGNYSFTATAKAEIVPAEQAAIEITGVPEHVYYGDRITSLGTSGGTGNGTVKWSVTAGGASAEIDENSGVLTIKGTGSVTVKAERTVPNYGTVSAVWTFTVEPKPVLAEVTITAKVYDKSTDVDAAAITAAVKSGDLVDPGDTFTLSGLTGAYDNANAGTGKTVTLDDANATKVDGNGKYTVSYPATVQGDITPRGVTVTVTLSGNDLQTDDSVTPPVYSYDYDGTAKTPAVTATGTDASGYSATLTDSDYSVNITDNKNVGDATVTVTAKEGGNYTFADAEVKFAIKEAGAMLTKAPAAKNLAYTGQPQDLVDVGTATGGTVMYSQTGADGSYSETIPQETDAGTYTVYYMVKGDDNHADTQPGQVSVTIKPKEITPTITLNPTSFIYDGTAKTPAVTVTDDGKVIDGPGTAKPEYSVSYRDNINAGTATVIVSDNNGGNYIVNGTATFEITKKVPTFTAPAGIPNLQYNGEAQELVTAGVCHEGTVEYSVNGGNYSSAIPVGTAVGTYDIDYKVLGDANHSDTTPVRLTVSIGKNVVKTPGISLSQNQFTFNNSQQKPVITVSDDSGRLIPEREYTVRITGVKSDGTACDNMRDVAEYTVKIITPDTSNYVIADDGTVNNTRTFEIVPADQESIVINGSQAQVRYGDDIQLSVTGGTGAGTISWEVEAKDGSTITSTISPTGLLTVRDVGGPYIVTVTRTRPNYGTVSAKWEFSVSKKPVTAVLTGVDRPYAAGVKTVTVTAAVPDSELVAGDSITIADLSGVFDTDSVGTAKKVTVNRSNPNINGNNSDKYTVTIPETTTASILAGAATVDTDPEAVPNLTYDARKAQYLVTAGTVTGGTMVYSLDDGTNFYAAIPKAKDAGTYTVYYKAQGDGNHTDSEVKSVPVTIDKQTVASGDVQIELTPPSAQYDGNAKRPEVVVRDKANNVIPATEYKVTYVDDSGENWTNQGTYTVKVENITGGNYVVETATADFIISTSAQAPLQIVNKPGLVHYGDTFTLSAVGGSGNGAVTWSSSDSTIADIDANGLVTIKGVGSATITATKPGGGNYDTVTATYPFNALQKPITAIITAKDRVYKAGDVSAELIISWKAGDLVGSDAIDTSNITGQFKDDSAGTGKTVDITGIPVDDTTAQKYAITIPPTTTASILKAEAETPSITANTLTYNGTAQALVRDGDANTLYSDTRDGVYSATVPTGTNAGTYTVWYKEKGDANHNDSQPQAIPVTISRKQLALTDANVTVELSGNDLQTDADGTYYYEYDGSDKTPSVIIKDGSVVIPASEYTATYSDNRNVGDATVTITNSDGGNYIVDGSVTFEIRKGGAELVNAPQPVRGLTYTGQPQQLVNAGTATGGHIEYAVGDTVSDGDYKSTIPTETNAGSYVVHYKVVGDGNHTVDSAQAGSVTVAISPKTVVSPIITVSGGPYAYDGSAKEPGTTNVKVEDGTTLIPDTEYTLSYRDNVNAGTATVIVTNANGGNYIVNGTGTFEITKGAASVATAPKGLENLPYNGTEQALIEAGTASNGTMVYSLTEDGPYTPAIPTGKAVDTYTVWYKAQGDSNHSDSEAQSITASIVKNTVTNPTIQVTPPSVTFNGEKQEPTVTVKDDKGFVIDGSEYTVTYVDKNGNSDLTQVGKYTLTIIGTGTHYDFTATAAFEITPAGQTPLTITGTRERVYYGDTIQLRTTGSDGTVNWSVGGSTIASIDSNGLLTITGVGSVTVTATSTKTGYTDQTATWPLYADKKQVTAVVTAADRAYNGGTDADLTVTISSGLVSGDDITSAQAEGHFTDKNVGENKTVVIDSLTFPDDINAKYDIVPPVTTTATIFKADVDETKVTAPTAAADLEYTGLAQALVTAGSSTEGTMEYSLDNITYSASLPTGTNAGDYEVWYRVKGDSNHNDTAGTSLGTVTIDPQTVTAPIVEFMPNNIDYDGKMHQPAVTVKDNEGRVIPQTEYTFTYDTATDWISVGAHKVTITDKNGGNYTFDDAEATFTILPAGQGALSIVNQPGRVQYGDSFTLAVSGGTVAGAVTWASSDPAIASIDHQSGLVTVHKSGGPVTITATRTVPGYETATATWSFSAEKKPVTAIVTAEDKVYDTTDEADLVITWRDGDLIGNDTIPLNLTGKFDNANVGTNKKVNITGAKPTSDKYTVDYNQTTTASITPAAASVTAPTPLTLEYTGQPQALVNAGVPTNGTITYSLDGIVYGPNIPKGTAADSYTVWYKVIGNENYKDVAPAVVPVTIAPKTVTNPTIELSPESFEYDGTAKKPDVVVKDNSTVIPSGEYTVSYSNNINVGTDTAKVTITDVLGGNYTVNGSTTFTITARTPALTAEPQPNNLTYTGKPQALVTAGTAVNGKVMYSLEYDGTYSTVIPRETDAGEYEVWYKVVSTDGTTETDPCDEPVYVTIAPKEVTPIIRLKNQSSYSVAYNGSPQTPDVTVYVESKLYSDLFYDVSYANNFNVGTAEVTVQSTGGNYQFLAFKTFEITKGKAEFLSPPTARPNLVYNGTAQKLVSVGHAKNNGVVLYSLDNSAYTTAVPTGINRDSYTVFAKVQGNNNYEESDVVVIPVEIGVNTVLNPTVSLSSPSFPYTGGEVKPTVTVSDDDGNVISADEYTVTYGNNVNIGTATVNIKSKTTGNYSFTASTTFTIHDASQTPLTITGKQDTVYYGDTLHLGTTGGNGDGAVTWTATGPVTGSDGQYKVIRSGSVTITATKAASGSYAASIDTWTFFANPKPVAAIVTAASKPYDGNNTATLTVTINSSDLVDTDTFTVTATGHFTETSVGENRTVIINDLTIPDGVSEKYDISWPATTTASITPAAASTTRAPALQTASLTYNGSPQLLLADGGEAEGGTIFYSVDGGISYSRNAMATDAGNYDVWYKVAADDENHKDSAPVNLGTVTIMANTNTPKVVCTPSSVPYDGKEKTPNVEVWVDDRIVPKDDYTMVFDTGRTAVGTYKVTVTDKPGGNYEFATPVEGTFQIVRDGQNPPSIITDKAVVYYGDSFRLSAMGAGNGPIQWAIKEGDAVAAVDKDTGVVTVKGVGRFVVEAYYGAVDGYNESGRSSVTLVADPKVVTPVVLIAPKYYDGNTNVATDAIKATVRLRDLVEGDSITITGLTATYDSVNAGTNKIVMLDYSNVAVAGTNSDRYVIDWPDSVTGTIDKAKVELDIRPAASNLTYNGSAQELVTSGTTVNGIGTIEYSLKQNSGYSKDIPIGTDAGKYTVWYKVEDNVNFTGIPAASVEVEIKKATPTISTNPTASGTEGQSLSDIQLNGGAINGTVPGRFTWKDGTIKPGTGTSQQWVVFTPNDTANYNVVEFQIEVTITSSTPSGSGSSSGGTTTSSTPTKTTVQNGTASTVVSAADGSKLVRDAAANQSQSIVIKPEITGDVTKAQVSIPASTVGQMSRETNAALTVSAPIADVTIPNGALDTLSQGGGTLNVVTEQVEQGIALTLTAGGKAVENVPGGVTLSVPAADAGPGTVAVLVHEDGTRETLRKSIVEDGKVNIPLSGSATVEIVDNSKSFADVPSTNWAADAVAFASAHELFSGTSATTFSPDQSMSRGMLATVLYSLEGRPDQTLTMQDLADGYNDVSGDAWYADGIAWAVENGIANGYGNGTFGPNDSITREQLAVMLWKYAGSPKASSQDLSFTDADQASSYAREALSWAVENGILSGYTNGQLAPGGTATRAQAAQMLKNFMESA